MDTTTQTRMKMEHLSNELFRWLQAGRRRNFCLLPAKKAKQLRLDAPLVPWTHPRQPQTSSAPPSRAYFFLWTHFRLSRWMATYLRMRSATPSVYFDLEKACWLCLWSSKTSARKTVVVKATPQVISNKKELQPITTMCLQWTVNKTGKYLATVQFLLSPLKLIF